MLDIHIAVPIPPGDENNAATSYSSLMTPVEMPAGTQPQIDMTSHSVVDTPPAALHHSTSSMDMTTGGAATASDSNQVIGFSGDLLLRENFLELQLPHIATAEDAVGSFYTPGMNLWLTIFLLLTSCIHNWQCKTCLPSCSSMVPHFRPASHSFQLLPLSRLSRSHM
jgi:hypothetical protein